MWCGGRSLPGACMHVLPGGRRGDGQISFSFPLDDVYSEGFDLNLSLGLALAF